MYYVYKTQTSTYIHSVRHLKSNCVVAVVDHAPACATDREKTLHSTRALSHSTATVKSIHKIVNVRI